MRKSLLVIAAVLGLVAIGSVAVWKTSGDDTRRQGALGAEEPVSLSWHGDWREDTEYAPGSVVSYDGASYVAEVEKLSTPEADCADCGWAVMALEGARTETETETKEGAVEALSGYEIVKGDLVVPVGASTGTTTVDCPAGKKVFGGGGHAVQIAFSGPVGPGTAYPNNGVYGWRFGATVQGGGATIYVYAICANAS
jgi:hypothetical protein